MADGFKVNPVAIANAVAKRSCLVCENYRAIHPATRISYCTDGAKTVFVNSGCEKWKGAA